ncbi:GNAT family N-acetyltransferase [Microbacterium bovistercoris]|uniref:GNAT family N-acetyltransferase n=1 Tax=Microbacterium bovistercoris TaxID=2293570 RepID=A0A371NY70_9MICO|nr:GNAT family N-acetyltransferase [Microbacterium bovistercoris]REJ08208.1 GNAT family N-acetyltransferase [Microbacterium bovistercoris]
MPLIPPSRDRFDEWVELIQEYGGPDSRELAGSGFHGNREPSTPVLTEAGYAEWLTMLEDEADETVPLLPDRVHSTYFWVVDAAGAWVGFLALRRTLNAFLLEYGGHIGYSIRPSRRREGHAARALHDALVEAAGLGLDRVLITCDEDNIGSARTIERHGGVYEDTRGVKRRYWVPTAP